MPSFSGDSRCVDQSRAGGLALSGLPGPWSVRCRCLGQSHREEKWGRSEGKCICLRRVTDCNCTYALSFPWTVTPLGVPKSFQSPKWKHVSAFTCSVFKTDQHTRAKSIDKDSGLNLSGLQLAHRYMEFVCSLFHRLLQVSQWARFMADWPCSL